MSAQESELLMGRTSRLRDQGARYYLSESESPLPPSPIPIVLRKLLHRSRRRGGTVVRPEIDAPPPPVPGLRDMLLAESGIGAEVTRDEDEIRRRGNISIV